MAGFTVRHHAQVAEQVKAAHRLMAVAAGGMDEAVTAMRRMAQAPCPRAVRKRYFEQLAPARPEDDRHTQRIRQRRDRWDQLFESGDGNDLPEVRGSFWAAYNAVTQWVDREGYSRRHPEPLNKVFFGTGAALKKQAFELAYRAISLN